MSLFGEITGGELVLNEAGKFANQCWIEIPNHFPNAVLHEYIIMPNHVHGIIELKTNTNVGQEQVVEGVGPGGSVGAENFLPQQQKQQPQTDLPYPKNTTPNPTVPSISPITPIGDGGHVGPIRGENFLPQHEFQKMIPRSIGSIVKGFKIGVTKWFRGNTDIDIVWQRNYHEHIIRNERSYHNISKYIINNPANWKKDKFY